LRRAAKESMQDTIQALLALQELDSDLYRVKDELRRLPAERAARRAQIDTLVGRRDETHKRALDLKVKVKELEDVSTVARQRIRKVENEMAHSRADVALHAAYAHQIKSLKKDISLADEQALTHMTEIETLENEEKRIQAEIDAAEKIFAEFSGNVDKEMASAQVRLKELEAQRKQRMAPNIEPEIFQHYERLLQTREGIALAALEERICQACYIQVPVNLYVRVARGTAVVTCPSCDRIFYVAGA
jgi:predicted  nucleic acid-binding Zn-ribbon protein